MYSRNYEILSGNTLVATWENGSLTVKNKEILPLYLKRIQNADMWLETRAIDRVIGAIRTCFLQAYFRSYCVKILANPTRIGCAFALSDKKSACRKSST